MAHFSSAFRSVAVVVALAALAVATAACGSSGAGALRDTAWELESLAGNDLIPGKRITLGFGTNEMSGSAGCNTYGGSYRATKENLTLSGVYATEMACMEPEGIMEQEKAYLDALRAAARYRVEGDRLEVYDEAGTQILVFVNWDAGER